MRRTKSGMGQCKERAKKGTKNIIMMRGKESQCRFAEACCNKEMEEGRHELQSQQRGVKCMCMNFE